MFLQWPASRDTPAGRVVLLSVPSDKGICQDSPFLQGHLSSPKRLVLLPNLLPYSILISTDASLSSKVVTCALSL